MKTAVWGVLVVALAMRVATAAPSEEQIAAAVENPARVVDILEDSETDSEAIAAVFAVLGKVGESSLPVDRKREHAALLIAHVVIHNPARSPRLMALLAARVDPAVLSILSAASSLAAGSYSKIVLDAIVIAVQASDELVAAAREAARNPVQVLGEATAKKIVDLPVPVVPLDPATTGITVLPVAKPIPEGPGRAGPPRARRYRGQ